MFLLTFVQFDPPLQRWTFIGFEFCSIFRYKVSLDRTVVKLEMPSASAGRIFCASRGLVKCLRPYSSKVVCSNMGYGMEELYAELNTASLNSPAQATPPAAYPGSAMLASPSCNPLNSLTNPPSQNKCPSFSSSSLPSSHQLPLLFPSPSSSGVMTEAEVNRLQFEL